MRRRVVRLESALLICAALSSTIGCADKAEPDLAKCIQLQLADDIGGAWDACNAAIKADPNSDSGKAAAAKLAEMKPKHAAWEAAVEKERAEAEEKARIERERAAEVQAQEKAARLARLRQKISYKRSFNSSCVSEGKPPLGLRFEGGTYEENGEVAAGMGCVREFRDDDRAMANYYCCPE